MTTKSISIFGLGKIGSTMTACYASKGYRVRGVDVDAKLVAAINEGRSAFVETSVPERLAKHRDLCSASLDPHDAILNSDITFIIVPTPSLPHGGFSAQFVCAAVTAIGNVIRKTGKKEHLVVLTSTVIPGTMDREIIPAFEAAAGRKLDQTLGFCYSPLFIALGNVAHNILNPDFLLVGESSHPAGAKLEAFYRSTIENSAPIKRMNFVNAELAKISVNAYVTAKISFANQLAEICEGLPGADVDVVTDAIGSDSRIGKKYLRGGTGYGGPCFPRDNRAFAFTAQNAGARAPLAESTDAVNQRQAGRMVALVEKFLSPGQRVGLLGMAYKPGTPVIEESQGVMLAQALLSKGVHVMVFDSLAESETRAVLGDDVQYARTRAECAKTCDVLVALLPCDDARILPGEIPAGRPTTIIDCWGENARGPVAEVADVFRIGAYQGDLKETRKQAKSA